MKAYRKNVFTLICLLLVALLVGSCACWIGINMQYRYEDETDRIGVRMDELHQLLTAVGAEGFIEAINDNENPLELSESMPDKANLILLDKDNKILHATNDTFIGNVDHLNLMAARFFDWREQPVVTGPNFVSTETRRVRLALLTDDEGNITHSLQEDNNAYTDDLPIAVGQNLPKYNTYFPPMDDYTYRDAVDYIKSGWSEFEYWIKNQEELANAAAATSPNAAGPSVIPNTSASTATPATNQWTITSLDMAHMQRARDYVRWENAQFQRAGIMRLVYRGPAWDGAQLVLIYADGPELHSNEVNNAMWRQRQELLALLMLVLVLLLIISMAGWVHTDAKKIHFHPAMWGILTLIGNVVVLIIYLMVRPNSRASKGCLVCRQPIKPNFTFCPNCGGRLCDTCANCKTPLEPTFHFCPNCGRGAHEQALEPTEILAPNEFE